jgi:alkylation response protein AidB-like acyl-CoA dehydrogenase
MSAHQSGDGWLSVAAAVAEELGQTASAREKRNERPLAEIERLRTAGLLRLSLPRELGGGQLNWRQAVTVVREIAKGDASLAAILGHHYLAGAMAAILGGPLPWQDRLADHGQAPTLWGVIADRPGSAVGAKRRGGKLVVNAAKGAFGAAALADEIVVAARLHGARSRIWAALPARTTGVVRGFDGDTVGVRLAWNGSVTLQDVEVDPDEVVVDSGPAIGTFNSAIDLLHANLYVGLGWGAFEAARQYTLTRTKPYFTTGIEKATADPYILLEYGEFWTRLTAAEAFSDQAGRRLQGAIDHPRLVSCDDLGAISAQVSAAKIYALRTGLDVASRIYDVTGGVRATALEHCLDRYWRDLRTHSLLDDVGYELADIGGLLLTGLGANHPSNPALASAGGIRRACGPINFSTLATGA